MNLVAPLVAIASVLLLVQALFTLYLMLYAWEYPERLEANRGPRTFRKPKLSFTVLLPARHEEKVIYETIRSVGAANYPAKLLEIVVITADDDQATMAEVRRAIADLPDADVRLETFAGEPINKPRGLNVGYARSSNRVVTIFDAEDDIHPDIFNVVNTVMLREKVGIVQAGVQLMNFRDHWYGIHNCLEYFFWFKSRLHFHAQVGMIPLGGNTVFLRRELVQRAGGWDEACLTEDADIGIRLSTLSEPIRVVYDAAFVTREETPDTIGSLVRQRTRWSQGFIQVLRKGDWLRLPRLRQRILAVYTLGYPILHVMLMLLWPVAIFGGLFLKLPVLVALVAFLPLYAIAFQFLLFGVGAFLFSREYGQRLPFYMPFLMAVTFLPYQWILGFSAMRAAYRELEAKTNWEKTFHLGAHRRIERRPADGPAPAPLRLPERAPDVVRSSAARRITPAAARQSGVLGRLGLAVLLLAGGSLVVTMLATESLRPMAIAIAGIAVAWLAATRWRSLTGVFGFASSGRPSTAESGRRSAGPADGGEATALSWVRQSIGRPQHEFVVGPTSSGPRIRALFHPTRACPTCDGFIAAHIGRCLRCGYEPSAVHEDARPRR
jgi:cellulose synthase/poly-beta-1,6-N-acetylglucosamine synthase-like glycosyltransferase